MSLSPADCATRCTMKPPNVRIDALARCCAGPGVIVLTLALAGCLAPGPTVVEPEHVGPLDRRALPSRRVDPDAFLPVAYEADGAIPWWSGFADAAFESLVATAFRQGFDVRIAMARLAESRSLVRAAGASRWPTLSLTSNYTLDQPMGSFDDAIIEDRSSEALAGLRVNWPLDLFGRLRRTEQAAQARNDSAAALLRDTKRVLAVQLASLYIQARSVQQRERIARESAARRVENVRRIERLMDRGYGTVLDLRRTENQLQQARADMAAFATQHVEFANQLAVLAARDLASVRDALAVAQPLWDVPPTAPLPTLEQLLRQRPDLRASALSLVAAAAELDATKAALFPSLSGVTTVLAQGAQISPSPPLNLVSGQLIADLALPLLGRGQLLAQVDGADARLAAALAGYEQTVLRTISEIDGAMNALARAREIHTLRAAAAASAREAEVLSRRLFAAGELDYVSVIVAEQTRASAEDAAIVAQRDTLLAYVRFIGAVAPAW